MTRIALAAACALITVQAAAAPAFYKWVDENGVVTYSQTPPPRQPADRIKGAPPPAEDPAEAREKLEQQIEQLDAVRESRIAAEEEREAKRAEQQQMSAACEQARQRLQQFPGSPRALIKDPDGTMRRVNDEEWAKLRQEAQNRVDELCK